MEVTLENQIYTLTKKERHVGGEAPAVRIKMLNEETKVIGMLAPQIQVMITLTRVEDFSPMLQDIMEEYKEKTVSYLITSSPTSQLNETVKQFDLDKGFVSNEFLEFASKFGLNMKDSFIAKSIFIINKEGEIVYKQLLDKCESLYDLEEFKAALHEAIHTKQKGHTHENWMG
ncbi:MAG: hypothetical protein ACNI3C_04000 [Candidatus Marinarcus sp.]|uniref:hypothetical protein n=1 Tax=Candidatus Marinarcus sp. TaxID=3100987 RepID=UPI003B001922